MRKPDLKIFSAQEFGASIVSKMLLDQQFDMKFKDLNSKYFISL